MILIWFDVLFKIRILFTCIVIFACLTRYLGRSRGAISEQYYHGYTPYTADYSYVLLFAFGAMLLIGICCLVMICSIICGFVAGKFYSDQWKKNSRYKRIKTDDEEQGLVSPNLIAE